MNLDEHLAWIMQAHAHYAKRPGKAFRKWDGKTLYGIHPVWCATTILSETTLDEQTRQDGALALLYHDVLEDTIQQLPEALSERVQELVNAMTFYGGSEQEEREIWNCPQEVRLYKLYDKVSNLLDGAWMSPERRKHYEDYTCRLFRDVEENYGVLNITKIARAITPVRTGEKNDI